MGEKLTRRKLAAGVLVPAMAAAAQAPAQNPEDPAALLKAAKEAKRRQAADLAKFEVPMATEPAFVFKP
jgi:dihydroxyacetone kinase